MAISGSKAGTTSGERARANPQQPPLLYADAIGGVLMSPVNSRITFLVQKGVSESGEVIAAPALEVVIPTAGLLNFLGLVRDHIKKQGPGLLRAFEEIRSELEKQVKSA